MNYRAHLSIDFTTDGTGPDETDPTETADQIARDISARTGLDCVLDDVTEAADAAPPTPDRIESDDREAWVTVPATLDMDTLAMQAGDAYDHAQTLRATDPAAAARFHSVAALLYHLHDGSYRLSVSVTVANRGTY